MRNVNLEYGVNLPKRGFVPLSAMLLMGAGALALPGAALALTGQPLAYVKNNGTSTISVIDTGDNHVVDTVPVGSGPGNVAVTPDGKFVYVLNSQSVSVIETTNQTDAVVATIPIGQLEGRGGISSGATGGIAVTPDGKSVYFGANNCPSPDFGCQILIGLIDTATNTFVSYQEIGSFGGPVGPNGIAITPDGKTVFASTFIGLYAVDIATRAVKASTATGAYALAVTPDGKFLYGAGGSSPISVIDTANLSVTATISATLGSFPAITRSPDGSFVYVTGTNSVLVIDTSTNAVARSIPVTNAGSGIAVTPDGKHLYVTDGGSNNVSVIDTVSETVSTKVAAGSSPAGVGIVPAPQFGTAFPAFTISTLDITLKGAGGHFDKFTLKSEVYVGATGPSNPVYEPINFQIGPYSVTIPAGSFTQNGNTYRFDGVIDGVALSVTIKENGTLRYALDASASGLSLAGVVNPVQVSLNDGGDGALTYATAHINHVP